MEQMTHGNEVTGTATAGSRRQLPIVHVDDHRVHQNLVRMMDRRLSNVQLQQHLYDAETTYHQQQQQQQQRYGDGSPRQSVDRSSSTDTATAVTTTTTHRLSIVQQLKSSARSSIGRSDSGGGGGGGGVGTDRGTDRYTGYYLGYVGQAAHKRRRTTFWETLTGLVCSLGALASRAAKMATRRGEPL
ncbi:hypothetical protein WH47_00284 [Habropoda laboriosa]|uniref:Uncharacterized protein n=1 Tax=Habropoda laboriosa TaxID=597456 RepID=A0A0L7R1V8_9HYME|nr:hypothetical protein WH47_00284 [Habropoda laboriosa]